MNHIPSLARVIVTVCLLVSIMSTTGCGPLLRHRAFNNSKKYFVDTPIENHSPDKGARASWHLITDRENAIPFLEKRLDSDDLATAGVAVMLLQAIAGNEYQEELQAAYDAKDWSQAPGNLEDYMLMIEEDLKSGAVGVMESQ